jgi:hypothetical protein
MPALNQYFGKGFIGVAPEAVIGTPVPASSYLQLLDESIEHTPGVVFEDLLRNSRDTSYVPVIAEQAIKGKVDVPLYVDQGLPLLAAAIGSDTYQSSTAAGVLVAIGASGAGLAAGSSAVTITTQTATPIAAGDYLQIQQATGAPSTVNLSEVHKVLSVTGAGPYVLALQTGETLRNTYTTAGVVARIPAATVVFTHNLLPDQPGASSYKTVTMEKNLNGLTSLQYAGTTVSKASLSLDTKGAAKMGYDVSAVGPEAQITASVPTYGTSSPLALANYALSLFGANDTSVQSFSLDIDQMAKEFYTFNGTNLPAMVPPVKRKISGKFANIVQDMTRYNAMVAGTVGAAVLTLAQAANSIVFTLPKIIMTKLSMPLKLGDLLLYDATFDAPLDDVTGHSVAVTVTNGTWLPFI